MLQTQQDQNSKERLSLLSTREREVFSFIVKGAANKTIAFDLGISQRTVENHRARIMDKLEADCVVDLVKFSESLAG